MKIPSKMALVTAVAALVAACAYVITSIPNDDPRLSAAEREVAFLRAEVLNVGTEATTSDQAPPSGPGIVERMSHPSHSADGLAEDVRQLTAAVDRLEQTARTLDSRIVRSRLAVPILAEKKAQLERGRKRLEGLRISANESREHARRIAISLNVPFDEDKLLERGFSSTLEENAAFVAARNAASLQQRMKTVFENKLADLEFSASVEVLEPETGE